MKEGKPVAVQTSIDVGFHLLNGPPNSLSWHLSDISYKPPEDASDPVLTSEKYPPNAAPGNKASVTLSFDVDEQGVPVHLQVEKSSDKKWEADVIAAVGEWRFSAGMRNFKAVRNGAAGGGCRHQRPSERSPSNPTAGTWTGRNGDGGCSSMAVPSGNKGRQAGGSTSHDPDQFSAPLTVGGHGGEAVIYKIADSVDAQVGGRIFG